MDILSALRRAEEALRGFTPEQQQVLQDVAKTRPDCKLVIPTPGTESRLNGVTPGDISKLVADVAPGQELSKREIVEGLGGNPKSSRDVGKINKALPDVPEIEMQKGTRGRLVRLLTGPSQQQ